MIHSHSKKADRPPAVSADKQLPQLHLADFSGGKTWQFVDEFDGLRTFIAGDKLAAMRDQVGFSHDLAGPQHYDRLYALTPFFVRHADGGSIDHGRMLQQQSAAIRHCQTRAAECERLAQLAKDPEAKTFYLRMAENWRRLAETRNFTERMDHFLGYAKK